MFREVSKMLCSLEKGNNFVFSEKKKKLVETEIMQVSATHPKTTHLDVNTRLQFIY